MLDRDAPSSKRAREEYENPSNKRKLLQIANFSTHDAAAAEDLLQATMARVLDPNEPR